MTDQIYIPYEEMKATFYQALIKLGFTEKKAETCALVFADNSLEGVYTHGVNRFPRFVEYVQKGFVKKDEEAQRIHTAGATEQWDGQSGPGIINALKCTDEVTKLADKNGIGCIALANTNHWMRGGAYGWRAAKKGYVFIGWTNTIANMPAWGAKDSRLGNNPLVLAVPYKDDAIVLDMAMSQYSFGSMEQYQLQNSQLPFPGGYNNDNQLTTDPSAILASNRSLPAGYWKGAGLSLLLDILAAILSGGLSTHEISRSKTEYNVSQVYITIALSKLQHDHSIHQLISNIIEDYKTSVPAKANYSIRYPGERALITKEKNLKDGIPVSKKVWKEIADS